MIRKLRFFLIFLGIITLSLISGFFLPYKWTYENHCEEKTIIFYVSSNGFHTSFILPVENKIHDWKTDFSIPTNIKYVEFGWGNKEFYMNRDFSIISTIKSLFPSETVMHVVFLDQSPLNWFNHSENATINVCPEEYRTLIQFIRNSFKTDSLENKVYLGQGLYGPSSFYEATGNYNIFTTCNTWVAEGLRKADVNTPLWSGTAQSIMWHLKKYNKESD